MIDIHCHILPGIDDGAKNLTVSLDMAKLAVSEGIHTIIATPHLVRNRYENYKDTIITKVEELNALLKDEKINLKILPGQEPRIDGDLLLGRNKGEVITLAGTNYIFIEFPSAHVPRYTEQLFYDIQLNGMIPIIVHPERNQEIMEHPNILYHLVEKGALSQITAASLCGSLGKKIKNFSEQLIEHNLAHFIASDAHNIGTRPFRMVEAFDHLRSKFGQDIEFLFKENAERLLEEKNVYKELPVEMTKKKRFLFF